MGNIITSRTNIASISNIEIELSAMNKDTDWVFVEDESLSSIARGRDGSKQIQYVLLKQEDGDVLIYEALDGDGNPLTYEHWAILMSEDSFYGKQARSETAKVIKDAPFQGLFFEVMGVALERAKKLTFTFALVNGPELSHFEKTGAEKDAFKEHFDTEKEGVAFYNFGKDARLVAPCPNSNSIGHYSHLAKFVRKGRKEQVDALFVLVAEEYLKALRQSPFKTVWLSTSGLGIGWLHFRIDYLPKYYIYGHLA